MKAENRIVEKTKGFFSLEATEKVHLPRLHFEVWDNDHLTSGSYIGNYFYFRDRKMSINSVFRLFKLRFAEFTQGNKVTVEMFTDK